MLKYFHNTYSTLKKYGFFTRRHLTSWLYLLGLISLCTLRLVLVGYIDAGFEVFFQVFNGTPISFSSFIYQAGFYFKWIFIDICLSVANTFTSLRMMDSISLKLKDKFLNNYFKKATPYGLKLSPHKSVTFSQIIENDIDALVFTMVRRISTFLEHALLGIGALYSLWGYSQNIMILGISIPYLPLAAIFYSLLFCLSSYYFSSTLNHKMHEEREFDQDIMNTLMHTHEGAHSIALIKGGKYEKQQIGQSLQAKYLNRKLQKTIKSALGFLELMHEKTVYIISAIACLPTVLAGDMISSRMLNISQHVAYVLKLGSRYHASMDQAVIDVSMQRIETLSSTIKKWHKQHDKNKKQIVPSETVALRGPLQMPNKDILSSDKTLIFSHPRNQLIAPSGGGKSTVFTTIAGLNPQYQGRIQKPKHVVFVPQIPYILPGKATLLDNCCYPALIKVKNKHLMVVSKMMKALHFSEFFIKNIDKSSWKNDTGTVTQANWAQTLSIGEKQCISLIRAILQTPKVLIIDEGTSALNSQLKNSYQQLINKHLPNTTIIYSDHHSQNKKNTRLMRL